MNGYIKIFGISIGKIYNMKTFGCHSVSDPCLCRFVCLFVDYDAEVLVALSFNTLPPREARLWIDVGRILLKNWEIWGLIFFM